MTDFHKEQFELCRTHGERIMEVGTKVEVGLGNIASHLAALNGSVAAHERRITELEKQTVCYDALLNLPEEVQSMRSTIAELTSSRKAALGTIREIVSILAVIIAAWSAYSAHQAVIIQQSPPAKIQPAR